MSEPTYGMSTDGPTPAPCDQEIFQKGETIAIGYGPSNAVERWVKMIAEKANARVDWHYSGGRVNMLHLGDEESRQRVEKAISENPPTSPVHMQINYGPGLYRAGV